MIIHTIRQELLFFQSGSPIKGLELYIVAKYINRKAPAYRKANISARILSTLIIF